MQACRPIKCDSSWTANTVNPCQWLASHASQQQHDCSAEPHTSCCLDTVNLVSKPTQALACVKRGAARKRPLATVARKCAKHGAVRSARTRRVHSRTAAPAVMHHHTSHTMLLGQKPKRTARSRGVPAPGKCRGEAVSESSQSPEPPALARGVAAKLTSWQASKRARLRETQCAAHAAATLASQPASLQSTCNCTRVRA